MRYTEVQWNLLKEGLLFSGQLSTTDNFLQNRWNDVQTFIAKYLCCGYPSIADIFLRPKLHYTLELPITGHIRSISRFYFRQCFTDSFKFSSIFLILFLASLITFSGTQKMKHCRDFQSVFTSTLGTFPVPNTSKAQWGQIETKIQSRRFLFQMVVNHFFFTVSIRATTAFSILSQQQHSCPLCWLALSRIANTFQPMPSKLRFFL